VPATLLDARLETTHVRTPALLDGCDLVRHDVRERLKYADLERCHVRRPFSTTYSLYREEHFWSQEGCTGPCPKTYVSLLRCVRRGALFRPRGPRAALRGPREANLSRFLTPLPKPWFLLQCVLRGALFLPESQLTWGGSESRALFFTRSGTAPHSNFRQMQSVQARFRPISLNSGRQSMASTHCPTENLDRSSNSRATLSLPA